jgi:predicted  nucleic acid-binding Zn-ribbon protein
MKRKIKQLNCCPTCGENLSKYRPNNRPQLSIESQLKGIKKALNSSKTPPQLKSGLFRRAEELQKLISEKI